MPEATTIEPAAETLTIDDSLYEVVDSVIVEKRVGAFESVFASNLAFYLVHPVGVNRLGRLVTEALFLLDPAFPLKRRPDVAFVSYDRWPKGRPVPVEEAWDVVPDLAIEVVSRSHSAVEVVNKLRHDFGAGVRQAWVVYPVDKLPYVYESEVDLRILRPGDTLDGGAVFPGLTIAVSGLFGEDEIPAGA